jgi:deoxyribonuclease V
MSGRAEAGGRRWEMTVAEARALQLELRGRLERVPPPDFAPRLVAGADVSAGRFSHRGYAGIVTLDLETLETVEEATAVVDLRFPYVPGYLSFRELPALAVAWEKLARKPDVVVFDAHGYAHPRRFGLGCHGGVAFDVPSIGCAKSMFVGEHGPLAWERGSTAPIVHEGETVGVALRTRDGCNPVYVSAGHRMDLETAVALVLALCRFREPETTRRAHMLVNDLRRADLKAEERAEG